jgi:amino acid transporter
MKISKYQDVKNTIHISDKHDEILTRGASYEIDIIGILIFIILVVIAYELPRIDTIKYVPNMLFILIETFVAVLIVYYISLTILSVLTYRKISWENEWKLSLLKEEMKK